MAKLFEIYAELALDSTKFDSCIKSATKQGKGFAATLKSGFGGLTNIVGRGVSATTVMMGNLMYSAVQRGAGFVRDFVDIGLDYNNTMETYVTNFRTMLGGSSEAAEKLTGDLESMAAATPFAMSDLADATQTLLSFGQDSSTVLDTLRSLGDISMGDAGKLQSLTLAFAQASSSGKLMGQDLMQMINAGFNPLQTIVEKTGASMGDLKDFMSNGKASADLKRQMKEAQREVAQMGDAASDGAKLLAQMAEDGVISAETLGMIFDMETSPGGRYYNAMKAASETFAGMLSTLEDDSAALLGKVFKPLTEWMKDDLMPRAQAFIENVNKGFDVGGLAGAWSAAKGTVTRYLTEMGTDAYNAGTDFLGQILTGLTGDQTSGEEIRAFVNQIWTDAKAGLDGLITAGGGLLKGIYDGLVNDGDNKTNIIEELSGLWADASASVSALIDSAGGLLGTIYEGITGQEATATNIGNTIAGVFSAGGTAIADLLGAATSFFSDLDESLGDPDASIGEKIGGVFVAGFDAMENLLNGAGTFMSQLYAAITGDTEGAAKIQSWVDSLFKPSSQIEAENDAYKESAPYSVKYDQDTIRTMMNYASSMAGNPWQYGITEDQAIEWTTKLASGNLSFDETKQIADEIGAALQYARELEAETKKDVEEGESDEALGELASAATQAAESAESAAASAEKTAASIGNIQIVMDGAVVAQLVAGHLGRQSRTAAKSFA